MNTIVLTQDLSEAAYQCRHALNQAQAALKELLKLADYPTPTTLAEVTTKRLTAFVEQRVNAVNSTPIYTQAQRDAIIDDWVKWRIKAMPHVVAIERFYYDWQAVSPSLDGGTIVTSNIIEALTPSFTVQVPQEAHQHIALIAQARQAITTLREWEQARDIKKIPLHKLINFQENLLLQSWGNSSIKIDHSQDDEGTKVWREALNAAIF